MKTFEGLGARLRARDPFALAGLALLGMAWIALLSLFLDAQHVPHSARFQLFSDARLLVGSILTVVGAATLLATRN